MRVSLIFAGGLAMTLFVSVVVVRYLSLPLRHQLQELCGSAERAEFWTALPNATVSLVPIIFAMSAQPTAERSLPPLLAVVGQVKLGMIGLVASILMLGWVLGRFIPRQAETRTAVAAEVHAKGGI
jgi:protein-S-isoprenylcysteine O-methyltransferase Ste14